MPSPPISDEELQRTIEVLESCNWDRTAAAAVLHIPAGTLYSRLHLARSRGFHMQTRAGTRAPSGGMPALSAQLREERRLRGKVEQAVKRLSKAKPPKTVKPAPKRKREREDRIRVAIPDSHGCFIDQGAAAALLADLKRLDPDEIVMLGDHVDCGGFLAQHHTMGFVAEADYTYEQDIAATNQFLDEIQKAAPRARIAMLEGNHEQRVERWCVTQALRNQRDAEFLRSVFAPSSLLRLKQRGIAYYRESEFHCGLPVRGTLRLGKCFFRHVARGRNAAASIVRQLGGNVVFGHTHRSQSDLIRTVSSGVIGAWNPGCISELQPLYAHSDPTDWSHGYHLQTIARSDLFFPLNVPIINGTSLLPKVAR